MPNVAVGNRILITFDGVLLGQKVMSMFVYGVGTITGAPVQSAVFAALDVQLKAAGGMVPDFLALAPDNYFLDRIWYQIISPIRYVQERITAALTGLVGENAMTSNTATTITRRGEVANRKNVSTLHVPVSTNPAVMDGNIVAGGAIVALTNLIAEIPKTLTTTGTVGTFFPVINNGPGPADFSPIKLARSDGEARVMRRRTIRLGI